MPRTISPSERIPTWAQVLDMVAEDKTLAPAVDDMLQAARDVCWECPVRRVYQYAGLGQHRSWLTDMALRLGPENQETFALAMSDMQASRDVALELPLLAAAFRLSRDRTIAERMFEQLSEMTTWSPLQRPGWTLFASDRRLPPDGKDGNWLATGPSVRAIADTLDIVPAESMPENLRQSLCRLLEKEIESIAEDWRVKRTWFVQCNNALTNQWVLPTEGLVRACLVAGRENYPDEYGLGVRNLLAALDTHGTDGEFEEGLTYAMVTVESMVHAARAMAVEGDMRALNHPFLQRFPTWMVHHFQPGEMMINAFDSGWAVRTGYWRMRPLLSTLTACTGNRTGLWALTALAGGPSPSPAGLAARALPPLTNEDAPPLFAAYERATLVTWRDSWNGNAGGVWVRGGHRLDQHDHCDRGHVNYVAHGRPILIEAGTPSYGHPHIHGLYTSGVGHNLLQLGGSALEENVGNDDPRPRGWQSEGVVAPIKVHRLDESGGHVGVAVDHGYDGLKLWDRDVRWDRERLAVTDSVALTDGCRDTMLFRWHLGTALDVSLEREAEDVWAVTWNDCTMTIKGSAPVDVSQKKMPDHTLDADDQDHLHTCILVRSAEEVSRFKLITDVRPEGIVRG